MRNAFASAASSRKPGRLALTMFRLPLNAYRHNAGWMLGHTFLEFTHTGRKTGRPRDAVAMVLRYDAVAGEAVICAAWGPETDWFRNLCAGPAVKVQLGRETFVPEHRLLSDAESCEVMRRFRPAPAQHLARIHRGDWCG